MLQLDSMSISGGSLKNRNNKTYLPQEGCPNTPTPHLPHSTLTIYHFGFSSLRVFYASCAL